MSVNNPCNGKDRKRSDAEPRASRHFDKTASLRVGFDGIELVNNSSLDSAFTRIASSPGCFNETPPICASTQTTLRLHKPSVPLVLGR
jgi:hypothetical protein